MCDIATLSRRYCTTPVFGAGIVILGNVGISAAGALTVGVCGSGTLTVGVCGSGTLTVGVCGSGTLTVGGASAGAFTVGVVGSCDFSPVTHFVAEPVAP